MKPLGPYALSATNPQPISVDWDGLAQPPIGVDLKNISALLCQVEIAGNTDWLLPWTARYFPTPGNVTSCLVIPSSDLTPTPADPLKLVVTVYQIGDNAPFPGMDRNLTGLAAAAAIEGTVPVNVTAIAPGQSVAINNDVTVTPSGTINVEGVAGGTAIGIAGTVGIAANQSIAIAGTPSVNIAANQVVGISGTPNVNISGGAVNASITSGTVDINTVTGNVAVNTLSAGTDAQVYNNAAQTILGNQLWVSPVINVSKFTQLGMYIADIVGQLGTCDIQLRWYSDAAGTNLLSSQPTFGKTTTSVPTVWSQPVLGPYVTVRATNRTAASMQIRVTIDGYTNPSPIPHSLIAPVFSGASDPFWPLDIQNATTAGIQNFNPLLFRPGKHKLWMQCNGTANAQILIQGWNINAQAYQPIYGFNLGAAASTVPVQEIVLPLSDFIAQVDRAVTGLFITLIGPFE